MSLVSLSWDTGGAHFPVPLVIWDAMVTLGGSCEMLRLLMRDEAISKAASRFRIHLCSNSSSLTWKLKPAREQKWSSSWLISREGMPPNVAKTSTLREKSSENLVAASIAVSKTRWIERGEMMKVGWSVVTRSM